MKYLVILLAIILSACASPPVYYSIHGVGVELIDGYGPPRQQLKNMSDLFIFYFAEYVEQEYEDVFVKFGSLTKITWQEGRVIYSSNDRLHTALALYHHSKKKKIYHITVGYMNRENASRCYFHELTHHFSLWINGNSDHDHKNKTLWQLQYDVQEEWLTKQGE